MNCADVRLDEYLDGELAEAARREVEAHLEACAGCREEFQKSGRLEKLLLSAAPRGAAPDADRFLVAVRARTRRRLRWEWAAAAAAALVAALAVWPGRTSPVDVTAELRSYAERPTAEVEARLRQAGAPALAALEKALESPDVRIQFAAATLLFKLGDAPTRDRVLADYQKKADANGSWTLSDPGAEAEDVEIVPVAVSYAVEGHERWALDVLRRLNRLSESAQGRIISSVVTLLKSDSPRVQKLALEIVNELDIEFPLTAIVDLLDSPELGDQALKVLREATRKDFGKDKETWRKALTEKPVRQ
jgi:hypothetical protein